VSAPDEPDPADPTDGTRRSDQVPVPRHLAHLPRDHRGYPVLATIPRPAGLPDFVGLSDRRKLTLAAFDLCALCALPFTDDDLRWQVAFAEPGEGPLADRLRVQRHPSLDSDVFVEAPLHEICALYAAQVCPFVSSPYAGPGDSPSEGLRPGSVVLAGYDYTVFVAAGDVSPDASGRLALLFLMGERVELRELGVAQAQLRGPDGTLDLRRAAPSDDRRGHGRSTQRPGDRDFTGRRSVTGADGA